MNTRPHPVLIAAVSLLFVGAPSVAQQSSQTFDAAALVLGPADPAFEALLDLDQDGFMDAVGARLGGTHTDLGLYQNDGTGLFTPIWTGTGPGSGSSIYGAAITGDFNGDGRTDFALWTRTAIQVFLTNGLQAPTALPVLTSPFLHSVLSRDINGDGSDDLVVIGAIEVVVILSAPTGIAPTFVASIHNFITGAGTPHDCDLIAHPDGTHTLALSSTSGTMRLLHVATSGAAVITHATINTGFVAAHITSGDVDQDGDEDLVLFNGPFQGAPSFSILRQSPGNTLTLEAPQLGGPATDLADVDGDGDLDGVCCGGGGGGPQPPGLNYLASNFEIALNDGQGNFAPSFIIPGYGARHIAGAQDLDGDGDVDLIAGRAIYFSQQSMTEAPFLRYTSVPGYESFFWSHRDGDGDGDVDPGFHPSGALVNDGSGQLTPQNFSTMGPIIASMEAASPIDVDGDGDLDFLIQGKPPLPAAQQGVYVATQVAPGVFTQGPQILPPSPFYLGPDGIFRSYAADLDGDGRDDLLVTAELLVGTSTSAEFSTIYHNLGSGNFARLPIVDTVVKGIGDFNQDGLLDFVGHKSNTGLTIVFNLGGMQFAPAQGLAVFGLSSNHDRIAVGDLDGDGDLDILTPQSAFGMKRVLALRNNGSGVFTQLTPNLSNFETLGGTVSGSVVRCVDVNLDGILDVLVHPLQGSLSGTAIHLGTATPFTFAAPTSQIVTLEYFNDMNGDGLPDPMRLASKTIHLGLMPPPTAPGFYNQYGQSGSGTNGFQSILGATGPFRVGSTVKATLRGGVGGAQALLGIGLQSLATPVSLATGQLLYLDMHAPDTLFFPITLSGNAGVPGEGAFQLNFFIPPMLQGITLHHQVGSADANAAGGIALSNAFTVTYGG